MDVVATAGHVDHGKSALVRALTGMEPDRWAEERRRGMTINLGFAWTTLPSGEEVAFVDVPGHERFVTNMLAGVGPAPAVLLVVAADEGWMPQTEEHVRALDALGVRHGLLVVTKADLADPQPVVDDARRRLRSTSLGAVDAVVVSSATGAGMPQLRSALGRLVRSLPPPEADAPVRLWVDRSFTIQGAGTVVTGTLTAGTLRVGDELVAGGRAETVVVRRLESRGEEHTAVSATARVAVNLRGVDRALVPRGSALVTPHRWRDALEVDVLIDDDLGVAVVTHIGAAGVPTHVRRLGPRAARLRFDVPLPLHYGDRLLLREPGSRRIAAAVVADLAPVVLRRRGAAAALDAGLRVPAKSDDELDRRGFVEIGWLTATGLDEAPARAPRIGRRWISADRWEQWRAELRSLVAEPLPAEGLPVDVVRQRLGLPDADLATRLCATDETLDVAAGRVVRRGQAAAEAPELAALLGRLAADPFGAPDGDEVRTIGRAALAHGVRSGALLHLGSGVYVSPTAPAEAVRRFAALEQPFTASAAKEALGCSRRVVIPLLEHLDAARLTRRLPDGTRLLVVPAG